MGKKVIWSGKALKQVEAIHKYISKEAQSLTIADKVVNTLFDSTEILKDQPRLYNLDRFKSNNDGTYHAYEEYSYRISYRVLKDTIRILRVRHTSRKPLKY